MMYYLELFPKWNIIIYSKSVEEVFIYNGFNMKRIFIVVLLLLGVNSIFGVERTLSQKQKVAAAILTRSETKAKAASDIVPVKMMDALTIMGYSDEKGFVVVANDDAYDAVLGYSFSMFSEKIPEGLDWWLKTVNALLINNTKQKTNVENFFREKSSVSTVPYLMSSTWSQREPFNEKCPLSSISGNMPAGCVATAMSQIMYYHKWPKKGIGTNEYEWIRDDGQQLLLGADFGNTYYEWNQMLDHYDNYTDIQADIIATLTFHCGVAINMDYSQSGSSADLRNACTALYKYFGYSENAQMRWRAYYSVDEWMELIRQESNSGRPILYAGQTEDYSAHAFVIDGYDENGMVHVNWGWGGDYDGMYNIKLLDPVPDKSYSAGQYMVIGIAKPSEGNIPYYSELANSSGFSGFNIYGKYIDSDVSPMACNESDRTIFGKFAVLIKGEGYFGELKTEDYSQGIEPGKVAIFRLYTKLPDDLPDGTYRIYTAFLENGESEWKEIRYTPGLANGCMLTKRAGEFVLEEIISGIDSVNYSDIKTGDITRVYDINGKEIYSIPAASFNKDNVPGYGIFIVKTGSNVEKIN